MSAPEKEFKVKLRKAATAGREAQRLLAQLERWPVDEDVLDQLSRLQGLVVLLEECYRLGRGLDSWAIELWLYEHGYVHPPEEDDEEDDG